MIRLHNTKQSYSSLAHSLANTIKCQSCQKPRRKKVGRPTKFLLVTVLCSIVLIGIVTSNVHASFKVITKIGNVNSFSGKYKIKTTLDNGDHKTITKDIGRVATEQDESEISFIQ